MWDNGVGILPDLLPKIFELFTQVDGSLGRSYGGLGIGLALARNLIELQDGRLLAQSGGLGKGSEFTIKLPVTTAAPGQESKTVLEPGERTGRSLRVLVVEDNVDSADSLDRDLILAKLDQGLSAQRIYQDLTSEHSAAVGYNSVKRFVRRLRTTTPLPFRRMECAAGEEAQVDFGTGARLIGSDGKRRKSYVFRVVLSHSRKGYSEATRRQTTEDFFRCLENAFSHFGGAPKTLVIDNLKAAVAHPDWFDPVLTPKVQSFCQHYGTVILPTKPRTPRHKGKIEAGVKYVKNNGLKGRTFTNIEEENRFLLDWEENVADRRIHGTTKRQVAKVFEESERPALLLLPRERFPCFQEASGRCIATATPHQRADGEHVFTIAVSRHDLERFGPRLPAQSPDPRSDLSGAQWCDVGVLLFRHRPQ